MRMSAAIVACAITASHGVTLYAQEPAGDTARARASAEPPIPWPIQLGIRTMALERSWPVIDQVVLVPDGRTYLDELSKWSAAARWPVLIEDDRYAPLFVRGFAPKRVIRRASVGAMPAGRGERESLIISSAAEAIADGATNIVDACLKREVPPSMVVLADALDPAWTAAAALSAGRCATIHFSSETYGVPSATLGDAGFRKLSAELEAAAEQTSLPWKGLGDAIDAFVVCRDIPWKATPELPAGSRIEITAGPFPTKPGQPISTLDALGRHADGAWWAMGAGIFGSEARSAYVAMSALFAPRESAWLVHTYDGGDPWQKYDVAPAVGELEKQGFVTQTWSRDRATLEAWRLLLMGGFGCDALFVNSHGVSTQFGLASGGTANVGDVPVFDRPAMVHFLHSFSLENPNVDDSVGGRFIEQGAYAYFGSVYEPLLPAFVQPQLLAARCGAPIPFLISARTMEGAMARPWRTAAYGDPLALLATPARIGIVRVEPAADGADTLRARAAAALARFRDTGDAGAVVAALRDLELCGDDTSVLQAWDLAATTAGAADAAPFALGALFRARDIERYPAAFAKCAIKGRLAREMLWHLFLPRLATLDDKRIVALLGRFPRGRDPRVDLELLKPTAMRALGEAGWGQLCDAAVRDASASGAAQSVLDRIEALR
jgi:hypothetical protein